MSDNPIIVVLYIKMCLYLQYQKRYNIMKNLNTTQEFLTANRDEVVNFYNNNVKGYYSVTLKDFMLNLMNNFRKITIGEDLKRFDLMGNLQEAKSRLGLFTCEVEASYSKPYSQSNHAKAANYFGADKANMMSNAK